MDIEKEITRFKVDLLRKMPFYGDIVMRLPFIENKKIATAQTNGGKIEYNPYFFAKLTKGQRNFVLMHEVFHVLLFHCKRNSDRNPRLWNTAADMVVNSMLINLMNNMREEGIPFEKPVDGIFAKVSLGDTVENLYEQLLADNKKRKKNSKTILVRLNNSRSQTEPVEMEPPDDIVILDSDSGKSDEIDGSLLVAGEGAASDGFSEQILVQMIRESASKNRSDFGSYFIPNQLYELVGSKRIKWQTILRDYFVEEQSDESSYTTPERKYIHMDLILPGYSINDEKIEEIWAFVDSSGSIENNEMNQFLTQLYRISKEFKCVFNICYWDTQVTDIYKKIRKEEDILKSLPNHTGGTDINCVYRWLKENKIKPDVMLLLTDGFFGSLEKSLYIPSLAKKTIVVLSGDIVADDDGDIVAGDEIKKIGRIARLE